MAVDTARAKSLFLAASELPKVDRVAFLDRECGENAELRHRVEALLAADAPEDATLTQGAPVSTASYNPTEGVNTVIAGKYTLVEVIGEGGMGSVWRAKQTEPVKRFVAVKLIKAGMDSKQVLSRFEAERQALALMDHPNIAKVLDGGLHEHRPFFVMELVKGVPITEYCDAQKLNPQLRLELFVQACQAIQHAHQKGIIHRDIKPSNVLVALYDDKPVVKVIDFGVAKATGGTLTEATIDTGFGGVVGTPQYMSPEQATFNNLDIDTRSDVYALGVLLYELLTGSTPFSRKELEKKGLLEILRVVREEEPPRPSTKLSTADALPSLSANRGTEPKKLTGLLRNELDWIVMKALEKDRTRRYETANGFAADVLRYLSGEAVQAHPPSTAYRLKKFVRRHKGQVIAVGLVLVTLLAGIAGTTLGLFEAKRQESEAKKQEAEAVKQAGIAQTNEGLANTRLQEVEAEKRKVEAEKKRADEEMRIARAVNDFLQNKLLRQASTTVQADALMRAGGSSGEAKLNPTIRELLDRAAKELTPDAIEANFPQQPLVQAQILRTVGDAYRGIGEFAIGLPFVIRSWELFKTHLGPNHYETLTTMQIVAVGYRLVGKYDLALPLFEEVLKLSKAKFGPDHIDTLTVMGNLAWAYHVARKPEQALPLMKENLQLRKAKFGPDHPLTLASMSNLASGYAAIGKLDLALPLLEESVKLMKVKLGPDHPDVLLRMSNLATIYKEARKHDLAIPLFEETAKLQKAKLGPDHPHTLTTVNNLALCYHDAGKLELALPLFEETLKLTKAKRGGDHPATITCMNNLAAGYKDAGKLDLAMPLYEETIKLEKAKLGPDHLDTLISMNNLAAIYKDAGKLDQAVTLYEETVTLLKAKHGVDHPHTLTSMGNLGRAYCDARMGEKATTIRKEFVAVWRKKYAKNDPRFAGLLALVASNLMSCDQYDTAEEMLRECLAIREKKEPDLWTTFNTQSVLGGALLGQKKYADAEPLLLKGYEGMKAREQTIPKGGEIRIPEALDRLIQLYNATNKPDEVKKYRELRAKYPELAPMPREKK